MVPAPDFHPAGGVGGLEVAAVDGPDDERLLGRLVARVVEHLAGVQRQPLHRPAQHLVLLARAAHLDAKILDDHRPAGIHLQAHQPDTVLLPFRQGDHRGIVAIGLERPGGFPCGVAVQAVEQSRGEGGSVGGADQGEMAADVAAVGFGEIAGDLDLHRRRGRSRPRPDAAQRREGEEEDSDEPGPHCGRGGETGGGHDYPPIGPGMRRKASRRRRRAKDRPPAGGTLLAHPAGGRWVSGRM